MKVIKRKPKGYDTAVSKGYYGMSCVFFGFGFGIISATTYGESNPWPNFALSVVFFVASALTRTSRRPN